MRLPSIICNLDGRFIARWGMPIAGRVFLEALPRGVFGFFGSDVK